MPVTLTRERVQELGEDAIRTAGLDRSPYCGLVEVVAFRNVLKTATVLARGSSRIFDYANRVMVGCPMEQAGLWVSLSATTPGVVFDLARAWDNVTRDAGLTAGGDLLIRIES